MYNQTPDLSLFDKDRHEDTIRNLKAAKEAHLKSKFNEIVESITDNELKRNMFLNK